MQDIITSNIVIAYTECKRKAFFLLRTNNKGKSKEYITALEDRARDNREKYINDIKLKNSEVFPYSLDAMLKGNKIIV
jgi:hypothetical protein